MRKWLKRLLLALAYVACVATLWSLAGCGPNDGRLNVYVPEATVEDIRFVDDAVAHLGLSASYQDSPYGAIEILLVRSSINHEYGGWAPSTCRRPCRRLVVSNYLDHHLSHEIGHALGLGHHRDPNNLMYYKGNETGWLEDWQIEVAHEGARIFGACRP